MLRSTGRARTIKRTTFALGAGSIPSERAYPAALNKEEVASWTGYKESGGGFNNALGRLRTLELVQGRGELRASDDLFDFETI